VEKGRRRTLRIKDQDEKKEQDCVPKNSQYQIGNSPYVQYGGKGRLPGELRKHLADHDGEFPCHMPLPVCPTDFFLDYGQRQERKLRWKGKGRLPGEVLEYEAENGVLPPHH
jgi:hypothetical protein